MALESSVSVVKDLSKTDPVSSDPRSEGDDHLRNIKTALLGTFASFEGTDANPKVVKSTEDDLSLLAGASRAGVTLVGEKGGQIVDKDGELRAWSRNILQESLTSGARTLDANNYDGYFVQQAQGNIDLTIDNARVGQTLIVTAQAATGRQISFTVPGYTVVNIVDGYSVDFGASGSLGMWRVHIQGPYAIVETVGVSAGLA